MPILLMTQPYKGCFSDFVCLLSTDIIYIKSQQAQFF